MAASDSDVSLGYACAISDTFSGEFRVVGKRQRRTSKMELGEKLRGRAEWCHRLALGIDDPTFTFTLGGLAHEYETVAGEAEGLAGDRKFKIVEAFRFGYDLRQSTYKRKRRLSARAGS
jgi:hypothetical protein